MGLYHVGARAYDPRTARWLQRDPIDAASGDPNLYRYCGNDPINRADPSGLDGLENAAHFAAGWGDRLTGNLTKHIRDWLCDLLDLPRWEPRDPCDEWYLAGHLVGAVHDRLLTRGAGSGQGLAKRVQRTATSGKTSRTWADDEDLPPLRPGSAGEPGEGKHFSRKTKEEVKRTQPDICVYCGGSGASEVDHIIPRSRGGNNSIDNAQCICPRCNRSKGNRDRPVTPPPDYPSHLPWPRRR